MPFSRARGRVERRGGGARANGDEGCGHFRAIGQYNRHAVIAANANGVQPRNGGSGVALRAGLAGAVIAALAAAFLMNSSLMLGGRG